VSQLGALHTVPRMGQTSQTQEDERDDMHPRPTRFLAVAVSLFLLGACTSKKAANPTKTTQQAKKGGSFSIANCEPNYLTPQRNYEACGSQVFEVLFDRLVSFDDKGQPVMDQAASVTSDDQKVWTIKIKPGWTFHDGTPVTAQSYVDAWNWTALGSNEAILNFFFERVEGYDALNPAEGKAATAQLSGLSVMDDTTFQVTLTAPFSQFPIQLGFDAFDPLPKAFFDDPKAYNEQPVGDGPYMMDGAWKHNDTINLKRYPAYSGTPGLADEIKLPIYSATGPGYADLQAGNVDIDFIGSDQLLQAQKDFPDTLQQHASSIFLYLGIPLYDKRFQNKFLRQALSLAVDRQAVMKAVLVAETPADSFAAKSVAGFRQGSCTYCHLDVNLAKQKLAQAGGWQGTLTINFYTDQTLEQALEAVANQWRQNLGIQDIKLNPINPDSYFDVEDQKKMTGPWWDSWGQDYPSIEDYLRPIHGTNGGYNETTYSNPAFDDLLAEGDRASSIAASIASYQKAEDILAEDMPIIPWGYLGFNLATSPHVTNVLKDGPFDLVSLETVQVVS
jgi:oligopeptide transport system substrate-binding protein